MRIRLALDFVACCRYIKSVCGLGEMNGEINIINQPVIYEVVDSIWDVFSDRLEMHPFMHHWVGIDRETWVAIQQANREALVVRCEHISHTHLISHRVVLWIDHVIPELIGNEENSWPNHRQYGNYLVELRRFFSTLQRMKPSPYIRSSCVTH